MIPTVVNPKSVGDPNQSPVVYIGDAGEVLGIPKRAGVDLDEVRRRRDAFCALDVTPESDLVEWAAAAERSSADVPALLADLDAAREALRRVEQERDEIAALLDITAAARDQQREHFKIEAAETRRMRPVVEAARAWRDRYLFALGRPGEGHGVTAQSRELVAAVDTYETQTGGTDGAR